MAKQTKLSREQLATMLADLREIFPARANESANTRLSHVLGVGKDTIKHGVGPYQHKTVKRLSLVHSCCMRLRAAGRSDTEIAEMLGDPVITLCQILISPTATEADTGEGSLGQLL